MATKYTDANVQRHKLLTGNVLFCTGQFCNFVAFKQVAIEWYHKASLLTSKRLSMLKP